MRPRITAEARTYPAFNARLGLTILDKMQLIRNELEYHNVNRFLVEIALGIIGACQSSPFSFGAWKPSLLLLCSSRFKAIWSELANTDIRRTFTSKQSKPVKLSFPRVDRERLAAMSRRLRWAEGQVLLECFQACAVMAAAQTPLENLPDIIELARARRVFSGECPSETTGTLLGQLNLELGLIVRPNLDPVPAPPPPMETTIEIDLI